MSHWTVRKRVQRRKIFASHRGYTSPLISLEHGIISIIKKMCCIIQSLTPTQGLDLVNSMIENTEAQRMLVRWKNKIVSAVVILIIWVVSESDIGTHSRRGIDRISDLLVARSMSSITLAGSPMSTFSYV